MHKKTWLIGIIMCFIVAYGQWVDHGISFAVVAGLVTFIVLVVANFVSNIIIHRWRH